MAKEEKVEKQAEIEELKAKLFERCEQFEKAEFETLKLEKYKTPILWDIGDVAIPLKEALGHGNWEPFVAQCVTEGQIGSKRTMERAMKIRKNFDNREDCVGLAVTEAETFSDQLETIEEQNKDRCQSTIARKKSQKKTEARMKKQENARLEAELEKKFNPQPKEDETAPQIGKPAPEADEADEGEAEEDVDDAIMNGMVESLYETLCDEDTSTVTPEEEAAFEAFVQSVGDPDRAWVVAASKTRDRVRKMYL